MAMPAPVPDFESWPRLPGKTTYLLGAGFSRAMGLPVLSDFVAEGLKILKEIGWEYPSQIHPLNLQAGGVSRLEAATLVNQVHRIVRRYSEVISNNTQAEHWPPSLETLFCAVDLLDPRVEWLSNEQAKAKRGNAEPRGDREELVGFIRAVCRVATARHLHELGSPHQQSESNQIAPTVPELHVPRHAPFRPMTRNHAKTEVCAYEAWLAQVAGEIGRARSPTHLAVKTNDLLGSPLNYAGPAVISLNYDLLLEHKAQELQTLKIFYGRTIAKAGGPRWHAASQSEAGKAVIPLLKLHGSLNWCERGEGVQDSTGTRLDIQPLDESHPSAELVLPTWRRDRFGGLFDRLMLQARIHLRLADRIVIIGYSLPETDQHIRFLLRDALATPEVPEIVVCNREPLDAVKEKLAKMVGPRANQRLKVPPEKHDFLAFVKMNHSVGSLESAV